MKNHGHFSFSRTSKGFNYWCIISYMQKRIIRYGNSCQFHYFTKYYWDHLVHFTNIMYWYYKPCCHTRSTLRLTPTGAWIGIKFYSLGHQLCFILFAAYTPEQNLLKTTTDVFCLEIAWKECRKVFVHLKFFVSISLLNVN